MEMLPANAEMFSWQSYFEDISSLDDSSTFTTQGLLEQINVTRDASDYLWYITRWDWTPSHCTCLTNVNISVLLYYFFFLLLMSLIFSVLEDYSDTLLLHACLINSILSVTSVDIGSSESFLHGGELPTLIVQSTGHALHIFINGQLSGILFLP